MTRLLIFIFVCCILFESFGSNHFCEIVGLTFLMFSLFDFLKYPVHDLLECIWFQRNGIVFAFMENSHSPEGLFKGFELLLDFYLYKYFCYLVNHSKHLKFIKFIDGTVFFLFLVKVFELNAS